MLGAPLLDPPLQGTRPMLLVPEKYLLFTLAVLNCMVVTLVVLPLLMGTALI